MTDVNEYPRPERIVDDPSHCLECSRLAAAFDRPWHDLPIDTYARVRASPLSMTSEAFAHYLPGYVAAAAGDHYWGQDHFDAIRVCSPRNPLLDSTVLDRARRDLSAQILYGGWDDSALVPAATVGFGEIRTAIERAFPPVKVPACEVVEGDPFRHPTLRAMFDMFAERTWRSQPSARVNRAGEGLALLSPVAFAPCVAAFLWTALDPAYPTLLGVITEVLADVQRRTAWGAPRWERLDESQRSILAVVLATP